MSWDNENQFIAGLNGANAEFGTVTLGADGTVAVPSHLSKVVFVICQHKSGALVSSSPRTTGVLTNNTFTITDPAGAANAGATVQYIAAGLM